MATSSSTIDYLGSRNSPDYVYYNATIVNNNTSTVSLVDDPEIIFQDNRDKPLLKDSADYVLSVENFALNGAAKLLPLLIPQIVTPVNDINLTIYTITFTLQDAAGNCFQSTQNLIWDTEDSSSFVTVPTAGSLTQIESPYYYLYSYERFVAILNKALALAWTDVKTAAGGSYGTHCPFFTYNDASSTFTLFQDVNSAIVPYGTTLPPPHSVASAIAGYVAGEFSFVGYDSNLEGLINNLATQYYGSNAILSTNGVLSLSVLPEVPTPIPSTGAVLTSYIPLSPAPPYQLYFDNYTTLISGTPYTLSATDAFCYPAGGAQLSNFGAVPIVVPANVLTDISVCTIQFSGQNGFTGATYPFFILSTASFTIPPNSTGIFPLIPNGSLVLEFVAGATVQLNTGKVYYPNNVVQVDLISSLPSQPINTAINGHLYLQQNTGGLVNPFTNTPISITNPVYVGTTEYQSSTDTLWSPVGSFVMTTTRIPVINEFNSNPVVLGSANTGFAQDSGNAFGRVLIEDAVDTDKLDYYKYQPYTPTMSSFSPSHEPLSIIDFRFWWRNRLTNSLIAMKLPNSGTVTVRLLFKKKGVE